MSTVVLVNEDDIAIGEMEKLEAHQKGLLHRAFSVFIFNDKGEMLLQQRAPGKYHSPCLWSNACCSHPLQNEVVMDAAKKRLVEEMGFVTDLSHLFSFIYKAAFENGLTEYEYDHVFTGIYNGPILPNEEEVMAFCFMSMSDIALSLEHHPEKFTIWFRIAFEKIKGSLRQV